MFFRYFLALLAVILVIGSVFLIQLGYGYQWTGFDEYSYVQESSQIVIPAKTLWDWLVLLIVPAAIAFSATVFGLMERRNERKIAEARRDEDRRIAEDRAQDTALETYFGQMSTFLLDKKLRASDANSEVRDLARTWTLTILRRLSSDKKGLVLRFLYESKLIAGNESVVSLSHAYLYGADLSFANLGQVNLKRADLAKANLTGANLEDAILSGIDLAGSSLAHANLVHSDLSGAILARTDLHSAKLMRAILIDTDLAGADLGEANLDHAIYTRQTIWPQKFDPAKAGAILVK